MDVIRLEQDILAFWTTKWASSRRSSLPMECLSKIFSRMLSTNFWENFSKNPRRANTRKATFKAKEQSVKEVKNEKVLNDGSSTYTKDGIDDLKQ